MDGKKKSGFVKWLAGLVVLALISVGVVVVATMVAVKSAVDELVQSSCQLTDYVLVPGKGAVDAALDVVTGDDRGATTLKLDLTPERMTNGSYVYSVGSEVEGIDSHAIDLALTAAIGRSGLLNLGAPGVLNAVAEYGMFQMPSGLNFNVDEPNYWGTPDQLTDPIFASARFYQEYMAKAPFDNMSDVQILQAVLGLDEATAAELEPWIPYAEEMRTLLERVNQERLEQQEQAIAVIGDAITIATHTYLFDDLRSAGYTSIRIDAQGGRSVAVDTSDVLVPTTSQTTPGQADQEVLVSGITAIQHMREQQFDPNRWMILLGTNDIALLSPDPNVAKEQSRRLISSILDEIGNDKLVMWLTVWDSDRPEQAESFNSTLLAMTENYPNLSVGDWAAIVAQNPEWLADEINLNVVGAQQRSGFLGRIAGVFGAGVDAAQAGADQALDVAEEGLELSNQILSGFPGIGNLIGCNLGSNVLSQAIGGVRSLVGEESVNGQPMSRITNPALAQVAQELPSIAGGQITYGAPRAKWTAPPYNRRGNFGHGSAEEWLSSLALGSSYRSADCSGFMNIVIYIAYDIRAYGCTISYMNLVLDGMQVTETIMQNEIATSELQPGDFIIKNSLGVCGAENHIVMVLGLDPQSGDIVTAESAAPDGYRVRAMPSSWYETKWPNLVVSRWIGPGAVLLPEEPTLPVVITE